MRTGCGAAAYILKAESYGLRHHQHTHSSAVGGVVNSFVLVKGKIPELMAFQRGRKAMDGRARVTRFFHKLGKRSRAVFENP